MRGYVEQLRGWDAAAERAEMQKRLDSGAYQIVLVDGRAAGVLAVTRQADSLHLKHVELLPECQGRMVGTAIICDLIAQARALGLPVTLHVLNVNPARRLYERLGFRVVAEVDTGPHGRKYLMSTTAVEPTGKE